VISFPVTAQATGKPATAVEPKVQVVTAPEARVILKAAVVPSVVVEEPVATVVESVEPVVPAVVVAASTKVQRREDRHQVGIPNPLHLVAIPRRLV